MRQSLKMSRIIKIEKIDGFKIRCMFNNGESRLLDFKEIFDDWKVSEDDVEYKFYDSKEFKRVRLRNNTLSWPNVGFEIKNENGQVEKHPYGIGPDTLFELSTKITIDETKPG